MKFLEISDSSKKGSNLHKIKNLEIIGNLFADKTRTKTKLEADNIFIKSTGEFHIGSIEEPFTNEFEIVLNGGKSSPDILVTNLITPANKALIVAGIMKVHSTTSMSHQ